MSKPVLFSDYSQLPWISSKISIINFIVCFFGMHYLCLHTTHTDKILFALFIRKFQYWQRNFFWYFNLPLLDIKRIFLADAYFKLCRMTVLKMRSDCVVCSQILVNIGVRVKYYYVITAEKFRLICYWSAVGFVKTWFHWDLIEAKLLGIEVTDNSLIQILWTQQVFVAP